VGGEAEPGYILTGDVTFIVTIVGEIITVYQSLLGWSLALENLELTDSTWWPAGPGFIQTNDVALVILDNEEIIPQDETYYQRLAVLPSFRLSVLLSQCHVLGSPAGLRDIVGIEESYITRERLAQNGENKIYQIRGASA
jgi:hypothetical protein